MVYHAKHPSLFFVKLHDRAICWCQ